MIFASVLLSASLVRGQLCSMPGCHGECQHWRGMQHHASLARLTPADELARAAV
jgi:hypothetical protein